MTAIVDHIDAAADRIRDDELLADKKSVTYSFPPSTTPLTHASQFESFKLGGAPPAFSSQSSRRHYHSRSHSRSGLNLRLTLTLFLLLFSRHLPLILSCFFKVPFPLFHSQVQQQSAIPTTVAAHPCPPAASRRRSWELPYQKTSNQLY